jgi:glycine cleavage system H protein
MNIPDNLLYTEDHEWVSISGGTATIGITDFAQKELGDIVYVEIETLGETLAKHDTFGTVEAVKTVSDLFMPIAGTVTEVNTGLNDNPEIVNTDPYGEGWMVRVAFEAGSEAGLLSPEEYRKHVGA